MSVQPCLSSLDEGNILCSEHLVPDMPCYQGLLGTTNIRILVLLVNMKIAKAYMQTVFGTLSAEFSHGT